MNRYESIISSLFDRVAAKDLDAVTDLFAEDAIFVDCAGPAVIRGSHAIRALVAEMWVGLPDFHVAKVLNIVGDQGRVLAEVEIEATHRGEYLGCPPSGATIRWSTAVVYELDPASTKIRREAYYYDSAGLLEQLNGDRSVVPAQR